MTTVLVTGASGFIGSHLIPRLADCQVRAGTRNASQTAAGAEYEIVDYDIDNPEQDYEALLKDIDVVVHLAGIAHTRRISADRHQSVNARGTTRLVAEAVNRDIKRFIFLSTIKVHGEFTTGAAVTEHSPTAPQDVYSISKLEAEQAIIRACKGSRTEYVILRPPLVYGPGVKANFLSLLRLVSTGIPLPLSAINNRRSFIYVENLADLIHTCIHHPVAANRIFMPKDYDDSTPGLIVKLSEAFAISPRLFPVPIGALMFFAQLTGSRQTVRRLTESLLVEDSTPNALLDWQPIFDQKTAFMKTINWFLSVKTASSGKVP